MTFTTELSTGMVSIIATDGSAAGCVLPGCRWSMPTYEYMCKKCGPFTQFRAMAECDLPSACPECGARSPRVILTAPGCLTMSAETRQASAKFERITDGLHDPGKLHGPGCSCCVGRISKMARRAKARASRPA